MKLDLSGKTAVVCGASKGIGRGVAEALGASGADLLLCSRNKTDIEAAALELSDRYHIRAVGAAFDIAKVEQATAFAKWCLEQNGKISVLVNNVAGPSPSKSVDTTLEAWKSGFEQLFLSSTVITQALLPSMIEHQYGRVITITSLSVVEPIDHLAVSTALRAAVTAYQKSLAKEVAPHNVTVNTVMPGIIHTDRIISLRKAAAARNSTTLEMELEKTRAQIPAGRFGTTREIGSLVAFLASPEASYITGTNIPVDGGMRKGWT